VEILPIVQPAGTPTARIANEIRNDLIFDINGGGYPAPYTHQLKIQFNVARQPLIVDINSARPDVEMYGINATFTLTEIATKKVVINGQTFSRVSFDNPSSQQRFAQARGLRDAENRAAKLLAENIRNRLASYLVAGT
jgi:LPS-assembly lipoprotein